MASLGFTMRTQRQLDYAKQLADPRWTSKRERIMARDEYICQTCGRHVEPLHVHHKVTTHFFPHGNIQTNT